jgi:UrcA family protein
MKTLATACATLALALTANPAMAKNTDSPSASIDVSGIDLTTAEGQAKLDRQIEALARSVCQANQARTGTRIRSTQTIECLKNARASAKAQVAAMIEEQQRGG